MMIRIESDVVLKIITQYLSYTSVEEKITSVIFLSDYLFSLH